MHDFTNQTGLSGTFSVKYNAANFRRRRCRMSAWPNPQACWLQAVQPETSAPSRKGALPGGV
jgi:hypothetical protein